MWGAQERFLFTRNGFKLIKIIFIFYFCCFSPGQTSTIQTNLNTWKSPAWPTSENPLLVTISKTLQRVWFILNYRLIPVEPSFRSSHSILPYSEDSIIKTFYLYHSKSCRKCRYVFPHTQVGNWSTFGGLQMYQQQKIIWPLNTPDVPREITNTLRNKTIRVVTFVVSYSGSVAEGVSRSVCLSVSQSVSQPVSQSVSQSVSLSVCMSVSQSVCLSFSVSVCLSVCLWVRLSVCLSISQSVSLSVCLSVCLSVSQSFYLSVNQSVS